MGYSVQPVWLTGRDDSELAVKLIERNDLLLVQSYPGNKAS